MFVVWNRLHCVCLGRFPNPTNHSRFPEEPGVGVAGVHCSPPCNAGGMADWPADGEP